LESWNSGTMGFEKMSFQPYTHYSIIPAFQYPSLNEMQLSPFGLERIFYEGPGMRPQLQRGPR
jgi:hypothetical protein